MIKIKEAIVVEGKYDKIKLSSFIDGFIVETGGFRIFKDAEKMELLRNLAKQVGLVVVTDSDAAGFVIRNHLKGSIPLKQMKQVYIPEVLGKERRKATPSKAGLLGVEGLHPQVIAEAFRKAGVTVDDVAAPREPITKAMLYADGFSGRPESSKKRAQLLAYLGLPKLVSANALLDYLNATTDQAGYEELVRTFINRKETV